MIDKDIERVKNIKYITLSGNIDGKWVRAEIPEEDKQAIENVLKELETKDKIIDGMAEYMRMNLCDAEKMYLCNGFTYEIKTCACMNEDEVECKEKIKEQFRKKVEKDDRI